MTRRNVKASKLASRQIDNVATSEEAKSKASTNNDATDDDGSFHSPESNTDQSSYDLDYSNRSLPERSKRSNKQRQQFQTAEPEESSSNQNETRSQEYDASNTRNNYPGQGVTLSANIDEELVESEHEDNELETSSFSNAADNFFDTPSVQSVNIQREIVDRNAPNIAPNNVESQRRSKSRKAIKPKKRGINRQIDIYRQSTVNLLPKVSFQRVVMEILLQHGSYRITKTALQALQETSELYMSQLFEDAYLLTLHRKAVTLQPSDLLLAKFLRETHH